MRGSGTLRHFPCPLARFIDSLRPKEVPLLPIFASLPADIDTWVGGGAAIVTSVERNSGGLNARSYTAYGQAELDFRLEGGPWYFRLDYDVQFSSPPNFILPDWAEVEPGVKLGPPEWAMLQYTLQDRYKFRVGIITHQMGYEEFDEWNTLFPTKSSAYNVVPGRMLGLEAAISLESGHDIFAFGGCDLDFGGCYTASDLDGDGSDDGFNTTAMVVGAGVSTLQATYGTWSGIAAFPSMKYYTAIPAFEFYPHEDFWFAVDGAAGLVGVPDAAGETTHYGFIGGTVTLNPFPLMAIHPLFRFQGMVDPHDAVLNGLFVDVPELAASAALTASPFPEFKISVEAKASKYGDQVVPGLYTAITLRRPEPATYTARFPEPEAAAAKRGERRIGAAPSASLGPRAF